MVNVKWLTVFKIFVLGLGILMYIPLSKAATVRIMCGTVGQEFATCKKGAEDWAQKTGNEVEVLTAIADSSERLTLYHQLFATKSSDVDVFTIDTTWPGLLSNHFLDLLPYMDASDVEKYIPSLIENNTVRGKLVALPWYTEVASLYYRKDLLEKYGEPVPETWEDLTRISKRIQEAERNEGNSNFWGFVFQGKAYEGLTCNALEWIRSFQVAPIVRKDGTLNIDTPESSKALEIAASWVGDIVPMGVLNYEEEEARGVFQSGNALFMRNWPYVWSLINQQDSPMRGKVGVALLPRGGKNGQHVGMLGGWHLAVSKYTRNPKEAVDLVRYLTGKKELKRRALSANYFPTIKSLYADKEILKKHPFMQVLRPHFEKAIVRPSAQTGKWYGQVSTEFCNVVHRMLSKRTRTKYPLKVLEKKLLLLSRNGQWR